MTIEIHKNELLAFEKNGPGWRIRTVEGTIWLTQPGDREDHVLSAGTEGPKLKDGKVVIEALSEKVKIELTTE